MSRPHVLFHNTRFLLSVSLACSERRGNNVPIAFSPLKAVSRFSTSTPKSLLLLRHRIILLSCLPQFSSKPSTILIFLETSARFLCKSLSYTMYSNSYATHRSNSVELSNNPFLSDPSNPYTRFPDISASSSSPSPPSQFHSGYETAYGNQTQYQAQPFQYQQQQPYLDGYSGSSPAQHLSQFTSTSHTPQYSNFSQPR